MRDTVVLILLVCMLLMAINTIRRILGKRQNEKLISRAHFETAGYHLSEAQKALAQNSTEAIRWAKMALDDAHSANEHHRNDAALRIVEYLAFDITRRLTTPQSITDRAQPSSLLAIEMGQIESVDEVVLDVQESVPPSPDGNEGETIGARNQAVLLAHGLSDAK